MNLVEKGTEWPAEDQRTFSNSVMIYLFSNSFKKPNMTREVRGK